MSRLGFAIVPTVLGVFGVAWSEAGIIATWMHERTAERVRSQILRTYPTAKEQAPSPSTASAMDEVAALLAGEPRSLEGIELDMGGVADFERRVYDIARRIPPGETRTNGSIARDLGEEPMRARDVGQALAHNRFAPIVPCHRVVAANGQLGGYSAPGGASTKRRLLELEGAAIVAAPVQAGLFD